MSSLLDLMSGGSSFQTVHVRDIRPNPNNFYAHINNEDEEIYVNDMAEQLKEFGQDSNAVVYEDTTPNDGKRYTLLAGERRWKAATRNFENGISDGMFQVKVISRPENDTEELLRIISNNAQRNKSVEVRKQEVEFLELCWQDLDERGQKPEGKKRDWIAKNTGMSPRQVQEYLTGQFSNANNESTVVENVEGTEENTENTGLSSADLDTLKSIQENMKEAIGRKVKISKKCAITIYPKDNCDMEDFYTILNDLGFTEEGFYK